MYKFPVIAIIAFFFISCSSTKIDSFTEFNYEVQETEYESSFKDADKFTIAVIPDIQNYVLYRNQVEEGYPVSYRNFFYKQMEYVKKYSVKNGGSIVFAAFLGDMVAKSNYPVEWKYADEGVSILDDEIPFGIVIGNHDYDEWVRKRRSEPWQMSGTTLFTKYFGPKSKHFSNKTWYGGSSENELNSWSIFKAGNRKFLFIGLEYEPSEEALNFAQKIIDKHKNIPCIIATHGYLRATKEKKSGNYEYTKLKSHGEYANKKYIEDEARSSSDIFEELVIKNSNVFLILCGHAFSGTEGEGMRVDLNEKGLKVYSLLSNYQSRGDLYKYYGLDKMSCKFEDCGDGFLRLMEFDMARKIIHVKTYSTEFNTFEIDADSDFLLDISDFDVRFSE